jgi:hypothetical protein
MAGTSLLPPGGTRQINPKTQGPSPEKFMSNCQLFLLETYASSHARQDAQLPAADVQEEVFGTFPALPLGCAAMLDVLSARSAHDENRAAEPAIRH